ncbi:MAG: hypothetical protein R3B97_06525 [Dehalococcoidia bacterium]
MTYAFIQDVPIREEMYAQIRQALGTTPPAGMISHVVIEKDDGTLRYVDVWESEAAWERFAETALHPIISGIFQRAGFVPAGEPPLQAIRVIDTWGAAPVAAG